MTSTSSPAAVHVIAVHAYMYERLPSGNASNQHVVCSVYTLEHTLIKCTEANKNRNVFCVTVLEPLTSCRRAIHLPQERRRLIRQSTEQQQGNSSSSSIGVHKGHSVSYAARISVLFFA
jgi:hypothetical protein